MRTNRVQDSPRAAERLRRAATAERYLLRTATDCPESGGLGCHADDDPVDGRCPHGWRSAQATLRRMGEVPDELFTAGDPVDGLMTDERPGGSMRLAAREQGRREPC